MRRNGGAQTVPVRSGRVGSGADESLATFTTLVPQRAGTGRSFGARDVPARSGWECPRGVRIIPGGFVVSSLLRAGTARAPGPGATSRIPA